MDGGGERATRRAAKFWRQASFIHLCLRFLLLLQEHPFLLAYFSHYSPRPMGTLIDNVIGNEDIAFHISSFLCPQRNPASLTEFYSNECLVAKLWNTAFGLVRAQLAGTFFGNNCSRTRLMVGYITNSCTYPNAPQQYQMVVEEVESAGRRKEEVEKEEGGGGGVGRRGWRG